MTPEAAQSKLQLIAGLYESGDAACVRNQTELLASDVLAVVMVREDVPADVRAMASLAMRAVDYRRGKV